MQMIQNKNIGTYKIGALNKTLILRLQQDTLAFIEEWAEEQGVSKSLMARHLIELGKKHSDILIKKT
jgi:hypothetical protein